MGTVTYSYHPGVPALPGEYLSQVFVRMAKRTATVRAVCPPGSGGGDALQIDHDGSAYETPTLTLTLTLTLALALALALAPGPALALALAPTLTLTLTLTR